MASGDAAVKRTAVTSRATLGQSREGKECSIERLLNDSTDKSVQQLVVATVGDLARHEHGVRPSNEVTLLVAKKA
jgi:hypothetical protein